MEPGLAVALVTLVAAVGFTIGAIRLHLRHGSLRGGIVPPGHVLATVALLGAPWVLGRLVPEAAGTAFAMSITGLLFVNQRLVVRMRSSTPLFAAPSSEATA